MENLMPSCLLVSSLPFSVSNCTEADALSCVQPTFPQQKDSSDWIGMVTMVAGGHKLLSCGSWHNSMHYLHPGANQSLYLISRLTNSHLLLSLSIKDAILLNSLRQGVRITENWKLILARPFSPDCRHLQAVAHPHSRSSKGGWEPIASVLFSWLTWGPSWPTRLPEAGPADLCLTCRTCLTIPTQVPSCSLPQSFLPEIFSPISISRTWSIVLACCSPHPDLDTSELYPGSSDRPDPS